MTSPVRTLILAGSFSEAAKYAKGLGLKQYRYAVNAHSVANFRPDDIVELPGYESRRDKHAFKSIIRNAERRDVHVRKDEYIPPPPPPEPQYGEEGYVADLLLGDLPDLAELHRMPGEIVDEILQDVKATLEQAGEAAEIVIDAIQDGQDKTQDDFVESAPARKRSEPKPPRRANKKPAPAPKTVTSEVDDLFED